MKMTWGQRRRKIQERKQKKLLEEQKKVLEMKQAAEAEAATQAEKLRAEHAAVHEAREKANAAKAQVDKAQARGVAPFPKHVEAYEAAQQTLESAAGRANSAAKGLEAARAVVPVVPTVPDADAFPLTKGELASTALLVLVDVFKSNKWVALAIVLASAGLLFLSEKQGWADFINF